MGAITRADREAKVKKCVELYLQGVSQNKIALEVGCDYHSVKKWLVESGVEMRPYRISDEEISNIKRLYLEENATASEIAKVMGYTRQKVANILRRNGLCKTQNKKVVQSSNKMHDYDVVIHTVEDPVFYVQHKPTLERHTYNGKKYQDVSLSIMGG